MTSQLRIYRIDAGQMDEFVALWRDHIVPARRQYGFTVDGAWVTLERDEFAWVVSYAGDDGFAAADKRYYDSPERAALPRSPTDFITAAELRLLEGVTY